MKKNYLLYVFEFVASIFVVFIHCEFPGILGDFIETIARFAVPFFFIITGFFGANLTNEKIKLKIKLYTQKLMNLFFVYLSLRIVILAFNGEFVSFNLTQRNLFYFIFFNNTTFIASHLWYLMALIYLYVFILMVGIDRLKKNYIFIFLPIVTIPLSVYILKNYGIEYSSIFRNWFSIGIPLFSIGLYINSKKDKMHLISNKKVLCFLFLGLLLTCLERVAVKYFFNIMLNIYFGSIISSSALFIFCMNNGDRCKKAGNLLSKLSENIYYYHYIFVIIFDEIINNYISSNIFKYLEPFFVLILTIILSVFISKFNIERGKNED